MGYPAKLSKSHSRGTFDSPNTTQPSPSATSAGPQGAFFAGAYNFTIRGGMFQNNPEGSVTITYDSRGTDFDNQSIFTNSFQGHPDYRGFDSMEFSPPMYHGTSCTTPQTGARLLIDWPDNTHLHTHHDAMNNYPRRASIYGMWTLLL